jgi:hypothetical protein
MPVSPYIIEIVAALERALAFAYTGDARVITKDLMGPIGLRKSLVEQGLPAIISGIKLDTSLSMHFVRNAPLWPHGEGGWPATASKRGQTLTYGNDHWMVCFSFSFPSVSH